MKENKYAVGTIHETNQNGMVEIIEYNSYSDITVRFLDTGYERKTRVDKIVIGQVRDKMRPAHHGVGFIGDGKYKSKYNGVKTASFNCWSAMLERCYSKRYQKERSTYKGCIVCDEWHNYQNFAKWYEENYPKDGEKYQLDKDLSCYGDRGKLYSPETCIFVTPEINTEEAHAKSWIFRSPNGDVVNIYNLAKFCRENKLTDGLMWLVANGRASHHKGWTKAD